MKTILPSYILLSKLHNDFPREDIDVLEIFCSDIVNPFNAGLISHDFYLRAVTDIFEAGKREQQYWRSNAGVEKMVKIDKFILFCVQHNFNLVSELFGYFNVQIDPLSKREKEIFALNVLATAMEGVREEYGDLSGIEKL